MQEIFAWMDEAVVVSRADVIFPWATVAILTLLNIAELWRS